MRRLFVLCLAAAALASAQAPAFTASSVLNAASSLAGPIAPGELLTIVGTNFAETARQCALSGQVLPTACAGVAVLFADKPAPLQTVTPTQITLQAPYDLAGTSVALQITREVGTQTLKSDVAAIPVASTAPALFTTGFGGLGAFTNRFGALINPGNPARPGDVLTALGTGFGRTNPAIPAGSSASGLIRIVANVGLTINDQTAAVAAATLAPSLVGVAEINFTVPAGLPAGLLPVSVTVGGVKSPAVLLAIGLPRPTVSGVSNSAGGSRTISPGSWVSIYGANLASNTREWRASDFDGPALPTSLDRTSVKINGKAAFVSYISPEQVNVQAPADTATGSVTVEVSAPGGVATSTVNLAAFSPGLFPFGAKYAAAVHYPDGAYVAPAGFFGAGVTSRPAKPGELILLFGTGFGPTTPEIPAGRILPAAPLADPSQLRVTIGGVAATVQYAGLIVPGEYQFNVVVPDLPDGDQPVVAAIGEVSSQAGLALPIQR